VDEEPPPKRAPSEEREVDFLICQNCSTPSYIFEVENGMVSEAQCLVCGNDVVAQFDLGDEAGSEPD
jgi:hypothetical protein